MTQPLHNLYALDILQRQGKGDWPLQPTHPRNLRHTQTTISVHNLVNPNEPPVSRLIYGGFLEHVGRCVYGGIVNDTEASRREDLLIPQPGGREAWCKDVLECLRDELQVPLFRWPGGNFVSNYHWQDGIGPIEARPRRTELAWFWTETNRFGTDEFIHWCRAARAEPYICLNMGTGTLEEALAWLEYCNGTGNSEWANLRRRHTGREEPHKVKYWGLGNEMYGPWQVGQMDANRYAQEAKRWAHALKCVDPSIELISSGDTASPECTSWGLTDHRIAQGVTDWDRLVLQSVVGYTDQHSIHMYTMSMAQERSHAPECTYENNVFGATAAEHSIVVCKALCDVANLELGRLGIPFKDIRICFDEWNVWDETKAPGRGNPKTDIEQRYDFVDLLGFTAWLHVLLRQHKHVTIGCMAQSVNAIAPIMTSKDGLVKQTIFYPLRTFSRSMHSGSLLQLPNYPDVYTGPTYPVWIQQRGLQPRYIDAVALLINGGDGKESIIRLSVINRHPKASWVADLHFPGFTVTNAEVEEMYEPDMTASNWYETPNAVLPTCRTLYQFEKGKPAWKETVQEHSWSFFTFRGRINAL